MAASRRWVVAVKHGIDVNLTRADPTSGQIDLAHAPHRTSDFDKNAVEEAVRLREQHGGTVTAVTVGPPTAREAIRDALALGADEGFVLSTPEGALSDSRAVASSLAAFLRRHEGTFDLALFGEGSTDHFSGTVGPRVAAELGLPSLSHVRRLVLEGSRVQVLRDLESAVEEVETQLPAVVTVGQEINTPRTPGFLNTLKASKKTIQELPVSTLGSASSFWERPVSIEQASLPTTPRKKFRVIGTAPDSMARELVSLLQQEGIVRA
jgi:electron transfer flavoprotein beta subunit